MIQPELSFRRDREGMVMSNQTTFKMAEENLNINTKSTFEQRVLRVNQVGFSILCCNGMCSLFRGLLLFY